MADIAEIGFRAQTGELSDAKRKLEDLSPAAGRAERAANQLSKMLGYSDGNASKFSNTVRGLTAANDNFARSVQGSTRTLNAFKLSITSIGGALGLTFGGAALVTGLSNAVKRLDAIETATRRIDHSLRLNGYTWDLTTEKIVAFAKALEDATGRDRMEVLDIVPNLASFGFTEKAALRSIALANDMAAAWGGDLRQNFEGLGRALADPINGFAMLSKRGITLDQTQKKLVKSLVETGQGLKAQEIIFEALEAQVKGVAEAGYTPLRKAMDTASKSAEIFFEKLVSSGGAGNALINVLNGVTTALTYLGDHIGAIVTGLEIFAAAHILSGIVSITGAVQGLTAGLGAAAIAARALSIAMAFVGGPVGLAVIALAGAYFLLRENISEAKQAAINANDAYRTNAKAMEAVERASGKYSQALRDQIAMQIEVAETAYTMAEASFQSAYRLAEAFTVITGFRSSILDYNMNKAEEDAMSILSTITKLQEQLKKVDANLGKNKLTDRNFGEPEDAKGKTKKDPWKEMLTGIDNEISKLQAEAAAIGMNELAAAKLTRETELLNQAKAKGIVLSDTQRDQLIALAHGMAELEYQTKKAKEALEYAKDTTKSFLSDLKSGLQQGKSFWQSFGDAALNVLDKIADKLLNDVVDAIFEVVKAGSGSGGGGLLSGILGGIGKLFGYAKGGTFANGISAHSNTVVDKPTLFAFASGAGVMGEAGPEAIMPLKRGPDGSLGVQMYNDNGPKGGGNSMQINYAPQYNVAQGADPKAIEELRKAQEEDRRKFKGNVFDAVTELRRRSADI